MKIGILSDTRYMPTRKDTPGHGLGHGMAIISEGLAAAGHDVTLYAAPGSFAEGCTVVMHDLDEDLRAYELLKSQQAHDVWLDGTHHFTFAAKADCPVVVRSCDTEAKPPRNAVYATRAHAGWIALQYGGIDPETAYVVYDGFDLADFPYNPGTRSPHMIWAGFLGALWKRPDLAHEIALAARRPLWLVGPGQPLDIPRPFVGGVEPQRLYRMFCEASALLHPADRASGAGVITEANATGTPVITRLDHGKYQESMEHGVTGFACTTFEEFVEAVGRIGEIKPSACREWVGDNRNITQMAKNWETALKKAVDGERW